MPRKDFLDEMIEESTKRNPAFPQLLEAAGERRRLLRGLAAAREAEGLSQSAVAQRMGTSQSAVARLEAAEIDAKLSTVERYAAALGKRIAWELVDAPATGVSGFENARPSFSRPPRVMDKLSGVCGLAPSTVGVSRVDE